MSHHSRAKRDILITSANVKIILAGVVSTSDVKNLRVDLDPTSQIRTLQTTQSRCSTCWSHPHQGQFVTMFSIICRLIPRHLGNLLVHVFLQLLHYRASLGTTAVDFTFFTRSFTFCVRTDGPANSGSRAPLSFHPIRALRVEVVDIMSSAVISLWVCSFLGVLRALLMIDFSSMIVFLCASLGPGAFCCVLQHHASCVHCEFSVHQCHFGGKMSVHS